MFIFDGRIFLIKRKLCVPRILLGFGALNFYSVIFHSMIFSFIINSHGVYLFQVSFSTNYYGYENFEGIVGVNVTAMLVSATLFITVHSK